MFSPQENCPNLEVLEVSNARFSTDILMLNIPAMQSGFQHMRVIRFANSKVAMAAEVSKNMVWISLSRLQDFLSNM